MIKWIKSIRISLCLQERFINKLTNHLNNNMLRKLFAISLFLAFSSALLLKSEALPQKGPQNRKAFLAWDREEKWKRYIDRERFREELVRKMQEMTRLHNTRL